MSNRHLYLPKFLLLASAGALLAACGSSGGGDSAPQTGVLNLGITDGPVDHAEEVVVQFTGVELKPRDGQAFSIDFPTPRTINLLAYQGMERATLLDGQTLDAGEYEWMRLKVNADPNVAGDSYIRIAGAECELRIPSGDQTGLKLNRGFTIWPGTITNFTIDFDLRKSVLQPPGQRTVVPTCDGQAFLLKPVLRLVDNDAIGSISGTVTVGLIGQECQANEFGNVYLFGPYTTTVPVPDDVDGNDEDGLDPLTSAMVLGDGSNSYTIGYAPAGNYVAAYTCSADAPDVDADALDTPTGADEVVDFWPVDGVPVTVFAGQDTPLNFDVVPAP